MLLLDLEYVFAPNCRLLFIEFDLYSIIEFDLLCVAHTHSKHRIHVIHTPWYILIIVNLEKESHSISSASNENHPLD